MAAYGMRLRNTVIKFCMVIKLYVTVKFYRVDHVRHTPALAKKILTRMLMRDLFVVANLVE